MKTPKITAIALTLLALTACANNTSAPPQNTPAEQTATTINTPENFSKTTTWNLSQELLQGEDTNLNLSPDGTQIIQASQNNIFYANLSEQTTTKFTIDGFTDDLVVTTGSTPDGKHPLILSRGETATQGASKASNAWKLFTIENQELKELGSGTLNTGESISISDSGILTTSQGSSSSDRSYQTVNNDLQVSDTSNTPESFQNCGIGSCQLRTVPVASTSSGDLRGFIETSPGRTCLKTDAITDSNSETGKGCLSGFKTGHWNSYDSRVAPQGADPDSASILAVSNDWVLGEWSSSQQKDEQFYKLMRIDDPEDSPVIFSSKVSASGPYGRGFSNFEGVKRLKFSPNHQYLFADSELLDVAHQKISSFSENKQTKQVNIQAVDDSGTGYGLIDSETPVEVHSDGSSSSLDSSTVLPSGFFEKDGKQYGVFIEDHDGLYSVSTAEYQK